MSDLKWMDERAVKSCQVPSNSVKMKKHGNTLPKQNPVKLRQTPSNSVKYRRAVPSYSVKLRQTPSDSVKSRQLPSSPLPGVRQSRQHISSLVHLVSVGLGHFPFHDTLAPFLCGKVDAFLCAGGVWALSSALEGCLSLVAVLCSGCTKVVQTMQ